MKKRSNMYQMKEIGRKVVTDLEAILASFELAFAEPVRSEREKPTSEQTPGQRVANPVWLRGQLHALIFDCDENIAEDQARADKERDDTRRARYEASVDCHRHYKRQLVRILAGKTSLESMADLLTRTGAS